MDSRDILNGHLSSLDAGVFIYAVLAVSIIIALIYFGRVFMAHRRQRLRAMKDPDFEASPPMYSQHFDDIPVDDQSCNASTSNGIVAHTTFPASALVRGENYYIVTPRARIHSNSSHPYSHSRSGSGASVRSASSRNSNNNVVPVDSPPAPYTSTDHLPMTQVGVRPPAYEDLSAPDSLGATTTTITSSTASNTSSSNP
ncbi:hypothetical protein BGX26_004453 [Mortierella sp. AD094]|nr:hypothetical protein BGX26_004453 [Mortierella sp. AD094]